MNRTRLSFIISLLLIISSISSAQKVQWYKEWSSSIAYSVAATKNGGYIIFGKVANISNPMSSAMIIRTNSSGSEEWKYFYGNAKDIFNKGIETSAGDIIAVGKGSEINSSNYYGIIAKTDLSGTLRWIKQIIAPDGFGGYQTNISDLVETPDGNILVIGTFNNTYIGTNKVQDLCVWLVKINISDGSTLWQKFYGRDDSILQYGNVIKTFNNSEYLLGSNSGSSPNAAAWLIKVNSSGELLWTDKYYSSYGSIKDIEIISDGIILLTSRYSGNTLGESLIKVDYSGNIIWEKTHFISSGGWRLGEFNCMCGNGMNGLMIGGWVGSYEPNYSYINDQIWAADLSGNLLSPTYRITNYSNAKCQDIIENSNCFIAVGYANTSTQGNGVWYSWLGKLSKNDLIVSGIIRDTSGNGLDGVVLTFSGGAGTNTTSGGGYFSYAVPYGWTGTVTPSYGAYTFSPTSKSYTNVTQNQTNQNYTATAPANPTISGYVKRESGRGIKNVKLVFNNGVATAITDDNGYYSQAVPYNWTGTITPDYGTYTFTPSFKAVTYVTNNLNHDFSTPIWLVSDVWQKLYSGSSDILNRQITLDLIPIRNEFWNEAIFNKIYNTADKINTVYGLGLVALAGASSVGFVAEFAIGAILNQVLDSFRSQWYYGISPDEWAFPMIVGAFTPDPAPNVGYVYRVTGILTQHIVTNTIFYRLDIKSNGYSILNPKQVSEQYSTGFVIPSNFNFKSTAELANASMVEIANKNIFTIGIVNERWMEGAVTYLSLLAYGANKLNPIVIKIPSTSSKVPPMLCSLISVYGKVIDVPLNPLNGSIYYYIDISSGNLSVIQGSQKHFSGHDTMLEDAIVAVGACPIDIHAYDAQGRHTGALYSGNSYTGEETNIPNSYYIYGASDSDPEALIIQNPGSLTLDIKMLGTRNGIYESELSAINSKGEIIRQSITQDRSISVGQSYQQSIQIGYNTSGGIVNVTFPSSISGKTTLQDGNTTISNVQIQALVNNSIKANTISNITGEYVLQVPPGTYLVKADASTLGVKSIDNVVVNGSQETTGIDFRFDTSLKTGAILVTTNMDQATFTITGPTAYYGSGKSWLCPSTPIGTYTIDYGNINEYITPPSETKSLSAGGTITFNGIYSGFSGKGKALSVHYKDGATLYFPLKDIIKINFSDLTAVKDYKSIGSLLNTFVLFQNYPNPFNPTTTIEYSIPNTGNVEVAIYNVQGRLVRSYSLPSQSAGNHTVTWDGMNENSQPIASGLYIYQVRYDNKMLAKRMLILK